MNNLDTITAFLGWCALINIAFLLISTVLILLFKNQVAAIHGRMFDISADKLNSLYFNYLALFKVLVLVFFVAPYFALRIVG